MAEQNEEFPLVNPTPEEQPSPASPDLIAGADDVEQEFPVVTDFEGAEEGAGGFIEQEFPGVSPDMSGAVGAVGRGTTRGLVRGGLPLLGFTTGAKIGAVVPPQQVTVPLFAFGGMLAAYFAGEEGINQLSKLKYPFTGQPVTLPFHEEPQQLRPFAVGGEVIGGGGPYSLGTIHLAQKGFRWGSGKVGNFFNGILDFAAEHPKKLLTMELGALMGSGAGEGTAEQHYPGEFLPRLAGGVAGAFVNPLRLPVTAFKLSSDLARKLYGTISPAARETRAGLRLQEIFKEYGEDTDLMIRVLAEEDLPGVVRTPAQRIGSKALIDIESSLKRESAKWGAEAEDMAFKSLRAMENLMTLLMRTGDPKAFMEVSKMRRGYFEMLIQGKVDQATREAVDAARKISGDLPTDMSSLSGKAHGALSTALKKSRDAEKEIWNRVDHSGKAPPDNLLAAYAVAQTRKMQEKPLDPVIEAFMTRMKKYAEAVDEGLPKSELEELMPTSQELVNTRTELLELAREAAEGHRGNFAGIYGDMAEAVLGDLDTALMNRPGYDEARSFSKALNDVFTRSFAGTATASRQFGQPSVPPEVLLRRALAGGNEASTLKFRELEEAAQFLPGKVKEGVDVDPALVGEATEALDAMLDVQQRYLRLLASEAIDETTGQINANKLRTTMNKSPELLERFPEVRADLDNALKSQEGLNQLQRSMKGFTKTLDQKTAFAKLAGYDNAADAIQAAVSSPSPITTLNQMGRMAAHGGANAKEGFKAAVWDYVARRAEISDGPVNIPKLRQDLFGELRPGAESLIDIMKKNGAISTEEVSRLSQIMDEGEKVLRTLVGSEGLEELLDMPGAFADLMLRVSGARFGRMFAGPDTGPQLIASQFGSGYFRRIFEMVPGEKVVDLMMQAAKDGRFMKMLLQKVGSEDEAITLARGIHSYLYATGFVSSEEPQQ